MANNPQRQSVRTSSRSPSESTKHPFISPGSQDRTHRHYHFRHAGRSTVNVSDVMLLARRNEGLESILKAFVEQQREEAS